MNDLKRSIIYKEVMDATRARRIGLVQFEDSCGDEPSESETKEWDSRYDDLINQAETATRLVMAALDAADDRIEYVNALDAASKRGMVMGRVEDNEDEDDEEEKKDGEPGG